MTDMKDSIDWIGTKEAEMRDYEEGLRLVKEISQSDEISYIVNNINSKPLNELRRCIGMKEEEKKLAAREAIIDMAKGLGKVEGKDGNNA